MGITFIIHKDKFEPRFCKHLRNPTECVYFPIENQIRSSKLGSNEQEIIKG